MQQRGKYQTRQQEAVAALFAARPNECLTAEQAYLALFENEADVGKTTVYRAITRLCEDGRLRRYASDKRGEAALYQHNPCSDGHLHIRCENCGALEHLHCEEVATLTSHLSQAHGFTLDAGKTVLYGLCEACQQKRRNEE